MDDIPFHHPLTPPHTAEDRTQRLRLLRSRRVGVTTFYRLMQEHGSAQAALDALPEIARRAGVRDYHICPERQIAKELAAGRKAGARLLCYGDPDYPAALHALPDAPPLMWVRGDLGLLSRPMLALVGARNASSVGTRFTRRLAADLGAEGFVIVSGLARGIDAAAHHAALDTGTLAVLGGGLDVIYPVENTDLYRSMAAQGVLMSEQPFGMKPLARHFPIRNRIVSGLSMCTIVIEAAMRSGSLLTARNAADQGREVMAVPGHPFEARSAGCNMLLRDGATLVRTASDVIDALAQGIFSSARRPHQKQSPSTESAPSVTGVPPAAPERRSLRNHAHLHRHLLDRDHLHREILSRLSVTPLPEDDLIRDLGAPADQISAELTSLELSGQIARRPGGLLSRDG
nr:DNA-processing protein DprA [uncultured Celeribacter sp.]